MRRHKAYLLAITMLGTISAAHRADAQSFRTYRCADGTQFIVGFYDEDSRAFVQIDGEPVVLARRLSVAGARYSGGGVTLRFSKAGPISIKHLGRPATPCAVIEKPGV